MLFKDLNVLCLPRTSSDHHLVLINTHPPRFMFGQHPFCLETIWFTDQSFPNLVDSSWQRHLDDISRALLDFTKHVKVWNQIFHKKKRLLARLNGIQKALCHGLNHSLQTLEKKLLYDYHNILHLEEEFWALKSD